MRPRKPLDTRAHVLIISRRLTRSSAVRGTMNDVPTRSPVVGDW